MSTKPCPTCGTLNDAAAGFCSSCSTVLATAAPGMPETPARGQAPVDDAPGYASGRTQEQPQPPAAQPPPSPTGSPFAPPPPSGAQAWAPPAGTSSNRRRFLPVAIGIAVIVVIRVLLTASLFGGGGPDSVTLPPTVGGLPQIVTGQAATNAQEFKSSMESNDVTGGDAAAYGTGTEAGYYVLVAPGKIDEQENFDQAKAGLESPPSQITVGPQTNQNVAGLSMICADLSITSGTTGEICVWSQDFQGIVISTNPGVTQTAQFAAQVHDSIQ